MEYESIEKLLWESGGAFGGVIMGLQPTIEGDETSRLASGLASRYVVKVKQAPEGAAASIPVFVKFCEEGTSDATSNEALKKFEKEARFYSTVAPAMRKFVRYGVVCDCFHVCSWYNFPEKASLAKTTTHFRSFPNALPWAL